MNYSEAHIKIVLFEFSIFLADDSPFMNILVRGRRVEGIKVVLFIILDSKRVS